METLTESMDGDASITPRQAAVPSVAYLGPLSSYSHQAAVQTFTRQEYNFESQVTIGDIFRSVESGKCLFGVVPFENSTNGSVVFTLDLFCDRDKSFPNTRVCGEAYLDVHHCLLGQATDISQVTHVYTHPQAFGQCEKWLTAHLKYADRVDVSSTSKAAQIAAKDPRIAAIANKIAAQVHNIQVLAENIEDSPDNTTRFFIISSTYRHALTSEGIEKDKSLCCFTVDHSLPGALADGLHVFKRHGLNLTSIVSRPSRIHNWNYMFFVEFDGHADTEVAQAAIAEMAIFCTDVRILGSYPDRMPRT